MNLPCVHVYYMSCHMRLYNNHTVFLITGVRHEPFPAFHAFFTEVHVKCPCIYG